MRHKPSLSWASHLATCIVGLVLLTSPYGRARAYEGPPPKLDVEALVEGKTEELEGKKTEPRREERSTPAESDEPSSDTDNRPAPPTDPTTQAQVQAQGGTTKGASGETEVPEPDYLALADAPIFLPRNYLYWGSPVGPKGHREPLVFGLEYALHLPIYSNLRDNVLIGRRFAGAATVSFEGALRMLSEDSKPVRMPSYRPNISGQLFYILHRDVPILFGVRVNVFHYSNGQERCSVDENLNDQSEACLTALEQIKDPSGQLNRIDGNFSSNGWLLELDGRVHEVNDKGVAIGHIAAGFAYQGYIHRGPGAMDVPTRKLYGSAQLTGNLEGKRRLGWASVTVRGAAFYYPNSDSRIPHRAGRVEVVLDPYWLTGLGFFARYYGGRDFYNAFFVDRLEQVSAGIAWDGERPLKFKRD